MEVGEIGGRGSWVGVSGALHMAALGRKADTGSRYQRDSAPHWGGGAGGRVRCVGDWAEHGNAQEGEAL